jgi:hypothetical protein
MKGKRDIPSDAYFSLRRRPRAPEIRDGEEEE